MAQAVCLEAEQRGSKDNITCVIVLFDHGLGEGANDVFTRQFTPGPICRQFTPLESAEGVLAYEKMARRANLTVEDALWMRYEDVTHELARGGLDEDVRQELEHELEEFNKPEGTLSNDERATWLEQWVRDHKRVQKSRPAARDLVGRRMRKLTEENLSLFEDADAPPEALLGSEHPVVRCTDDVDNLMRSVLINDELQWTERMRMLVGHWGEKVDEEEEEGIVQVRFAAPLSLEEWLPANCVSEWVRPA